MKLEILDAAEILQDLRIPPGNRLEKLSGIEKAKIASASMTNGERGGSPFLMLHLYCVQDISGYKIISARMLWISQERFIIK